MSEETRRFTLEEKRAFVSRYGITTGDVLRNVIDFSFHGWGLALRTALDYTPKEEINRIAVATVAEAAEQGDVAKAVLFALWLSGKQPILPADLLAIDHGRSGSWLDRAMEDGLERIMADPRCAEGDQALAAALRWSRRLSDIDREELYVPSRP